MAATLFFCLCNAVPQKEEAPTNLTIWIQRRRALCAIRGLLVKAMRNFVTHVSRSPQIKVINR
jgi:hypothetical protein